MPGITTESRQRAKKTLVQEHGGKCVDCGFVGKPWQMDFDHRVPADKEFSIGSGGYKSILRLRIEAAKCDLVCANCHRTRTHRQRCTGCEDCQPRII